MAYRREREVVVLNSDAPPPPAAPPPDARGEPHAQGERSDRTIPPLCDVSPRSPRTPASGDGAVRLAVDDITKSFGSNRVLKGVDLTLRSGEIVAFMGANGAGKSTLVKIVGGVHRPDGGTIELDGRRFAPRSPSEALRSGVVIVHQSINDNVVLTTDVLENLMIDRLCGGGAVLFRRKHMAGEGRAMMAAVGLDLPLDREVGDLSLADRQMVAIARAMAHDPKLLILDEPTSALSEAEAERLFAVVERLRERGVPILYISHRMGDIRRLADRIVTLRDGTITGDFAPGPDGALDHAGAVHAMLGRSLVEAGHEEAAPGRAVMECSVLSTHAGDPPIDLVLHEGEVTALVGLVGAGKTELAECLFGVRRPAAGTMRLDGAPYVPRSTGDAVRAGVHMTSEDRAGGSIVPDFDITCNVNLPFLAAFSRLGPLGLVDRRAETRHAASMIERLGIVAQGPADPIGSLSGGNQQKVVLARWLSKPARLIVLDEPFQGVDIAARRDIGTALRDTASDRATLVLCADLDEATEVADRLVVLHEGRIVGEHRIGSLDRDRVVRQMSGHAGPKGGATIEPDGAGARHVH